MRIFENREPSALRLVLRDTVLATLSLGSRPLSCRKSNAHMTRHTTLGIAQAIDYSTYAEIRLTNTTKKVCLLRDSMLASSGEAQSRQIGRIGTVPASTNHLGLT